MTWRDDTKKIVQTLMGLAIAIFFGYLLTEHLHEDKEHFWRSLVFVFMMCVGMGIFAPGVFFGSMKQMVVIAIDAKKGGDRFTDKLIDEVKESAEKDK
jgi:uncharacterized membrane protein YgaE (UPF0421/DUF939 family)